MSAATSFAPPSVDVIRRCGCGQAHSRSGWASLRYVGPMDDGAGGRLELRNCRCGSTLAIQVDGKENVS